MDITLTMTLDCTDRFASSMRDLNEAMSKAFGSGVVKRVVETEKKDDATGVAAEPAKEQEPAQKEPEPVTEAAEHKEESAQPEEEKKDAPIDPAKDYTAGDVRKAMHEARLKIEGPDYENNQQGEGYVKYHNLLSKEFVSMARLLGSNKPSALPADRRAEFINDCKSLVIKSDGTIGREIPF